MEMKKIWIVVVELCEYEKEFMYFTKKEDAERMREYLSKRDELFEYRVVEDILFESFEEAKKKLEEIEREEFRR